MQQTETERAKNAPLARGSRQLEGEPYGKLIDALEQVVLSYLQDVSVDTEGSYHLKCS